MRTGSAIITVALCVLVLGSIGGVIGFGIGKLAPAYYVGRLPGQVPVGLNALSIGVPRGIIQGAFGGAIVGLALVTILGWQRSRTNLQPLTGPWDSGVPGSPENVWVMLIAGSLLALCLAVVCSGFLGLLIGERHAAQRQFFREQEAMAPILASDPAFAKVEILEFTGGGIWLSGEVATDVDLSRLKTQFEHTVGTARSRNMFCVQIKKR